MISFYEVGVWGTVGFSFAFEALVPQVAWPRKEGLTVPRVT